MNKYIGKKLEGRYEIMELVGFGGMAIVFKAYDILEDKYVAVKILKDEFLANDDFKRRFRNESKAIAVLSHPSIVRILDVCFNDSIQYIVMEYIDGITLKEYIEQQGEVKWKEAVHFSVQILRALQHAHDNGIVHRDVKPQNVMLLADGTIKVMDFGIARFARENGKTMSDKAIGSVHYISPEQAKGDTTDEKTDIYAVGVIIYEMLTGKVPFDGESPVSIAIKQMQIEPERPRLINPDIPIGLEEIILRAMQKDPTLRYQTASEMLRDIDEFKRNPSVLFEYKYLDQDGTTKYFDKVGGRVQAVATNDEQPAKKSYVLNILAGVTAACVFVAIVAVVFFIKMSGNTTKDVQTVSVIGMTTSQAKLAMPDVLITVASEELSNDFEKGTIIKQDPAAGIAVKIGTSVNVTVSLGFEKIVIPDVVGDDVSRAKKKLIDLGLDVEQVNKVDKTVERGIVISTDPSADTEMNKGDTVTVYVSLGAPEEPLVVPNLSGLTEQAARSKLASLGLKVGTTTKGDSIEEAGTIIDQTPAADTKVEKGSIVDIVLSTGTDTGTAPGAGAGTNIYIQFPSGETGKPEYIFEVRVNETVFRTDAVNPAASGSYSLALPLVNGLIGGVVPTTDFDMVTILVDGATFASYYLDYELNSLVVMQEPNFSLLFPYGFQAATPPPSSVAPQSSSSGVVA